MKLGVGRFESVSILGFNSPEWLLSNNGAIAAGGFAAGIYTTNEPPACKYIVDHCNARVIVVEGQKQLDKILAIRAELPKLAAIVVYGGDFDKSANDGVGPGTQWQREKASMRLRAQAATEAAFEYRLPAEAKAAKEAHKRSQARMREHDVVENRIQEGMASGSFDHLKGHGKPLELDENVYETLSGDAVAHKLLKNAGCAPAWVEKGKEARGLARAARADLAKAWLLCADRDGEDDVRWAAALADFEEQVGAANKVLRSYNLSCPSRAQQRTLRLDDEVERVMREPQQLIDEHRASGHADTAAPERRVRMPGQMPRGGREFQSWGGGYSGGFSGGGGGIEMPAAELTLAHVELPTAVELGSAELPSFSEAFFAAFSGEPPPVVAGGGGGGSVGSRARAGLVVRTVDV